MDEHEQLKRLFAIIDEEEQARREAYVSYCEDVRRKLGDEAKVMTFEEWEEEFEKSGGWAKYF